jgi:nucleoside-diphosphate-sugar epimerase
MGAHVLITGAAGFIGSQVLHALLAGHALPGLQAPAVPVARVLGLDPAPAAAWPDAWTSDPRCQRLQGDASAPELLAQAWQRLQGRVDLVLALGATLTTQAEQQFDQAWQVNVLGLHQLLQACRAQRQAGGPLARLVFSSSIACYGGALPELVDDSVAHTPQTSYGTHKAINELLIADFSRLGFVDGRALRLPIVVLRPGEPGSSVSDRVAGLVREPLRGRDVVCPWRPDTLLPLAGVQRVAASLLAVAGLPAQALGPSRALNLPALSVRTDDWVGAAQRLRQPAPWRAGAPPIGRVHWQPDAALQAIVDAWPRRFSSERALALGLRPEAAVDEIINPFLRQEQPA